MKKFTALSLFIFWAIFTALLTAGLVVNKNNGSAVPGTTGTTPTPPSADTSVMLSAQEIATHNTTTDCWMIVNGNVYNITSYIPRHPGGAAAIKPYCGKDGTAAFEGLPHSTNAHQLLANFFVGAVGQKATTQTIRQTTAPTIPAGGGGDDD